MAEYFTFECGCKFPILDKTGEFPKIDFSPKLENVNLECSRTWDLISSGNTKGVFQLESRLGHMMAKKLKPENINQLSDLISIIRPGALDAIRDGKSVTNHYIDKKNGVESLDFFHSALEPSLKSTLGEMIYQEQAMQIAKDVAGFNLKDADTLRKIIGKKLASQMATMKSKFLEGCKSKNIVNESEAEQIFGWIEKSQRYSFNRSILDDTVVISEDGPKSIKDLNIGEKILAPTNNGDVYVEVLNKYNHGDQEVFLVALEDNYEISCTMEHKFLCEDHKVRALADILLHDHKIICIRNVPRAWVRIEKLGIKPTVDIEVKSSSHIFYGNGIATSNSHGVSYAINAYLSAYAKAHFPRIFFASYLKFAKDKIDPQQEIKELVRNANEMDILVKTPDFRNLNRFFLLKNKDIYFGLTDIKGVGESVYKKILDICKDINIKEFDWLSTLFTILININSTASKALISCGAFDYFKKNRTEMLFEYETCSSLTQKETEKLIAIKNLQKIKDLKTLLTKGIEAQVATKKRMEILKNLLTSLENPPYSLTDKIEWLSDSENSLLGVSITCSKLDSYDIEMTNTDCKTLKNSAVNNNIIIAGEITNINVVKTKTGKNPGQEMAFVSIEDQTGFVDSIVMFPEQWTQFKSHLFIGNVLIFVGNKAKNKDGLIVEKCFAPKP